MLPHDCAETALLACMCPLFVLLQVVIQYKSHDRLLQAAQRVWAYVGHSGWQHTLDVELFRRPGEDATWTGIYR
jgi:hypothetical protein